jgi:5-methylcytosine-specific restriction endonuclease McrA
MTTETKLVPASVRAAVYERDSGCCRVCGRYCDTPGLHHVVYRSQGGLNVVENLITIGWTPGHDCHNSVVHANKNLWMPILQAVIARNDGVNARQLLRWARAQVTVAT